jgi:hypothetical protein
MSKQIALANYIALVNLSLACIDHLIDYPTEKVVKIFHSVTTTPSSSEPYADRESYDRSQET